MINQIKKSQSNFVQQQQYFHVNFMYINLVLHPHGIETTFLKFDL